MRWTTDMRLYIYIQCEFLRLCKPPVWLFVWQNLLTNLNTQMSNKMLLMQNGSFIMSLNGLQTFIMLQSYCGNSIWANAVCNIKYNAFELPPINSCENEFCWNVVNLKSIFQQFKWRQQNDGAGAKNIKTNSQSQWIYVKY